MIFEVGGGPVAVRWYRAAEDQIFAPEGNLFVSGNWVNRDLVVGELGEQPGSKPWANGADPHGYPLQAGDPCVLDAWLQSGLPIGETTGPWTSENKLECCDGVCDCHNLADNLQAEFTNVSGCSFLEGTIALARAGGNCVWLGEVETWLGTAAVTLTFDEGLQEWTLNVDCFTGDSSDDVSDNSCPPVDLTFTVADSTACCSFGGGDSFTVRVTEL